MQIVFLCVGDVGDVRHHTYADVEYNGRVDVDGGDVGEPPRVAARGRSPGGERNTQTYIDKRAQSEP